MVSATQSNPFVVVESQTSSAKNPFAEAAASAAAAASALRKAAAESPRASHQKHSSGCCKDSMDIDSCPTRSERRSHKIACCLHEQRIRAGLIVDGDLATRSTAPTDSTSMPLQYFTEMEIDSTPSPMYPVDMELDTAAHFQFSADMELDSDCEFVQAEERALKSRQHLNDKCTDSNNKKSRARGRGRGKRNDANKTTPKHEERSRECNTSHKRAPPPRSKRGKELFPHKMRD